MKVHESFTLPEELYKMLRELRHQLSEENLAEISRSRLYRVLLYFAFKMWQARKMTLADFRRLERELEGLE